MPASAATVVSRMLESLDPSARRLVEAAAVMAEPTPLVVLGQVAAVTHPSPALTAAALAGLTSVDDHDDVDCAHDLLREAILHGLSTERRRDLHSRAARHATGDRKLAHRAAAQDRPDPQLVADLLDAADSARASLKYGVAAAHRLRARTVSADPPNGKGCCWTRSSSGSRPRNFTSRASSSRWPTRQRPAVTAAWLWACMRVRTARSVPPGACCVSPSTSPRWQMTKPRPPEPPSQRPFWRSGWATVRQR